MAKFKQHIAGKGGWSDWDVPIMKGYKLACCDCGLVHDMEFRVLQVTKRLKNGSWAGKKMSLGKWRIEFRAKRNNRSTALIRMHNERKSS